MTSAFSNVISYYRRSFSCTGLSRSPNTIVSLNMLLHFPVGHVTRTDVSRTQHFSGAHNRPEVFIKLRCSQSSHRRLRIRASDVFIVPLVRRCEVILLRASHSAFGRVHTRQKRYEIPAPT